MLQFYLRLQIITFHSLEMNHMNSDHQKETIFNIIINGKIFVNQYIINLQYILL